MREPLLITDFSSAFKIFSDIVWFGLMSGLTSPETGGFVGLVFAADNAEPNDGSLIESTEVSKTID